jgi:hypothetical protein
METGMIGRVNTDGPTRTMISGSKKPVLSNDPIAWAVPVSAGASIVLDTVFIGVRDKIRLAPQCDGIGDLGFVSDDRFLGRCIAMLRQRATELFDLANAIRHKFADDIGASVGEADPHVHCRLIPRQSEEPKPQVPAWLRPRVQNELAAGKADDFKQRIVTPQGRLAAASTWRRSWGTGCVRSGSES